jgi:SAM-dependent methyltransferase
MKCSKTGSEKLDKEFWDARWKTSDTGWDMQQASPPLKAYIDSITDKQTAILIPGCGNAYEAEYLLEEGFANITVIDIAPALVGQLLQRLEQHAGHQLTVICGDFFKHTGRYDVILEQTFFCAITPDLRKAYVQKMHELLKDNGKLAGLLFDRQFDSHPPFGGSKNEYLSLFSEKFRIERMESCELSIPSRKGSELFFELTKKDQA